MIPPRHGRPAPRGHHRLLRHRAPPSPSPPPDRAAQPPGAPPASFVPEPRLPGASVGIVRDGRLVWSYGYGFADRAAGRRPDAQTLYRVASISKTFTASSILQLRD